MKRSDTKTAMIAVLLIASALRLIAVNQSFWLDEAINVTAARDLTASELISTYTIGDFHPPLYHALLWGWLRLLPTSEVSARLPSVIFGVAAVAMTYAIALVIKKDNVKLPQHQKALDFSRGMNGLFGLSAFADSKSASADEGRCGVSPRMIVKKPPALAGGGSRSSAWFPALLVATSGLHIYYSQEARMYAMATLLSATTFFALIMHGKQPTAIRALVFIGSLSLLLFTDYQPWLLVPILLVMRPQLTLLALLTTLPWWPHLAQQIERGLSTASAFPAWRSVVGTLSAKSLILVPVKFLVGRVSIDDQLLYAVVLAAPIVVSGAVLLKLLPIRNQDQKLVVAWLAVPLVLGAAIASWIPIFAYFRFLFLLPFFYILLWLGMEKLRPRLRWLAGIILVLTNVISSTAYLTSTRFQREDWRVAVQRLEAFDPQRTLVVFPNLAQSAGFAYYNQGNFPLQDRETLDLRETPSHVIFVKYVSEIFDPQNRIPLTLEANGYRQRNVLTVPGILMWHYQQEEARQ